jgi:hypothetical protein
VAAIRRPCTVRALRPHARRNRTPSLRCLDHDRAPAATPSVVPFDQHGHRLLPGHSTCVYFYAHQPVRLPTVIGGPEAASESVAPATKPQGRD